MVTCCYSKVQEGPSNRSCGLKQKDTESGLKKWTLQPLFLPMHQTPFGSSHWPVQPIAERQESLVYTVRGGQPAEHRNKERLTVQTERQIQDNQQIHHATNFCASFQPLLLKSPALKEQMRLWDGFCRWNIQTKDTVSLLALTSIFSCLLSGSC